MELLAILVFCISAQILRASSHPAGHEGLDNTLQQEQIFLTDDFIDVSTGSQFHGMSTSANLPYVDCLSAAKILGAMYTSVSARLNKD